MFLEGVLGKAMCEESVKGGLVRKKHRTADCECEVKKTYPLGKSSLRGLCHSAYQKCMLDLCLMSVIEYAASNRAELW